MKVLALAEDYCVLKIRLAVSLLDLTTDVIFETHEDLLKLDTTAKSILLVTESGEYISQHVSILRYIAQSTEDKSLLGVAEIDRAMVDQWLEFSWHELGRYMCSMMMVMIIDNQVVILYNLISIMMMLINGDRLTL